MVSTQCGSFCLFWFCSVALNIWPTEASGLVLDSSEILYQVWYIHMSDLAVLQATTHPTWLQHITPPAQHPGVL